MNHHLNIFRFYNENETQEFIENNLSRAFALTLKNDPLFFNEYIKAVVDKDDYDYLFNTLSDDSFCKISLQIDTNSDIETTGFKKIYAVALTTDKELNMSDFFNQKEIIGKNINRTDILITIKDLAIVIEVKKTNENCKQQLYNQIIPFLREELFVKPTKYSWQEVINLMEKTTNLNKLISGRNIFTQDFLDLCNTRYPHWFEAKPFSVLQFTSQKGTPAYNHLLKRLNQAFNKSNYKTLNYNDRYAASVEFGWAQEMLFDFESYNDNIKNYIVFYIYPGNTKGQGYKIFNKPLSWIYNHNLVIENKTYELEIVYHLKLCHFNKYVTGLNYHEKDLKKPTHTSDNFYKKSGKWNYEKWDSFEKFMDDHFLEEFNWREKSKWRECFLNTDRTYFTMSLGFELGLFIPYKEFSMIDKQDGDVILIANKINAIGSALQTLI